MNLKKPIAIALAATALLASIGCGDSGIQSASNLTQSVTTQQNKPLDEATIKAFFQKWESSNIEERKKLFPLEKLPANILMKTTLIDSGASFDWTQSPKLKDLSVFNIKQDGDFASAKVSYIGPDNQRHSEDVCFRKLEGKWCGDIGIGIKSAKRLRISGYDEAALEAAANIGYTYEDEPIIVLDVRSKTTAVYQVGRWSLPSYILITDQGEFPLQNTTRYSMNPAGDHRIASVQPSRFILPFKGATGMPKALRITGFNEVNSEGFPISYDSNQVVTFTLGEQ